MFLRYTVTRHNSAPEVQYKYTDSLYGAQIIMDDLMDEELPGKRYSDFALVDSSKKQVLKVFDEKLLRSRKQGRDEAKARKDRRRGIR